MCPYSENNLPGERVFVYSPQRLETMVDGFDESVGTVTLTVATWRREPGMSRLTEGEPSLTLSLDPPANG